MNAAPFDPKIRFDRLTDHRATLGESPVYDQIRNCLWWVDITGMELLRTDLHDGRTDRWQTPEQIGFVVLTDKSGVIVGMETGLFLFDPKNGGFSLRAALPLRGIRFNDATTDADGRLWAGTMDIDNRRPVGKLYRIDASFGMTEVLSGLTTINGLAVDDDLGRLYVSDSCPDVQKVWVMDIDLPTGNLGPRRVFADMRAYAGRPDGAALDASGNYWLAGVDAGIIHVFSRDGGHLSEIRTPIGGPTKPAFVGPDLKTLCITSKGGDALNGALFVAPGLPVSGRSLLPFRVA